MDEKEILGIPLDVWGGAILGAILTLLGTVIWQGIRLAFAWWRDTRPASLLLQRIAKRGEPCLIFVTDFLPSPYAALPVQSGTTGASGHVRNVPQLWSSAESRALADVLYVLGVAGKNENIEVIEKSKDTGIWDGSLVVLGALADRSFEFYERTAGVAYKLSEDGIYDVASGQRVELEPEYDYGIILKTRNPLRTQGGLGTGILIGGMGVLATQSAGYYFRTQYKRLAADFGGRTFGIVVRVSRRGGAGSVERLPTWDRPTERKSVLRLVRERILFWSHKQL